MAWSEGLRDTLRFWPLVLVAFVHAVASCSLLGLSFQQASEAQEVDRHLQRWEQLGAASLRGFYLAAPGHLEGGGAAPGESQQEPPEPDLSADSKAASADDGRRAAALLALLEDPHRTAYTMDPYGDRFGDDLPGALLVTEDFFAGSGLAAAMSPTGQSPHRDADGTAAPYAVLGSDSSAKDPYALTVGGVLPPPTRVQFQDAMIPVTGRLAPGATALDPMMGSVPLDGAVLVVVPPSALASLYPPDALEAILLRTIVLGQDAVPALDAAGRALETDALVVNAEPLTPQSSALLQSLSASSRTLLVLFGAAVLGAVVSLFGVLGVLARALAPTWRIAAMVGAARWQAAVRIIVPVLFAWVLPAAVGLTAGASALPGPPPTGLTSTALIAVMAIGAVATLSSWRALAATFGRRPRRHRPTKETARASSKSTTWTRRSSPAGRRCPSSGGPLCWFRPVRCTPSPGLPGPGNPPCCGSSRAWTPRTRVASCSGANLSRSRGAGAGTGIGTSGAASSCRTSPSWSTPPHWRT
ncbi:hypothetical protein BW40_00288 [Micrococcus luteus]|nr:hypothetical protein BW40_00288 [Micrococcus luteus]